MFSVTMQTHQNIINKMAANIRRNTFIVSDISPAHVSRNPRNVLSNKDRQNLMRLKVNRVALIQELRVEHVVGRLQEAGLLTEADLRRIESERSDHDRARLLVDIVPTKTNVPDWYKSFRDALLNPQGADVTKQRYRFLVEFLDNTLIHPPKSPADKQPVSEAQRRSQEIAYPRFEPLPDISEKKAHAIVLNLENDEQKTTTPLSSEVSVTSTMRRMENVSSTNIKKDDRSRPMVLVKGFVYQWIPTPDNFRSLIEVPNELVENEAEAGSRDASEQLQQEKTAVAILRKIELVVGLARRRQLPPGFQLCMCDAVQELLSQHDTLHVYFKYIRSLQQANVQLVGDVCASFKSLLGVLGADRTRETSRQTAATGFRLVDLLVALEKLPEAEEMLIALINFLNINPGLETWMDEYNAHVRLMGVRNDMYELNEAQSSYFSATQLTYQIQLVSFGQQLVFEGRLHKEMSAVLLECGSINSALGWSRKALQEVDPADHEAVIEVVSHAVLAYCSSWQAQKAGELAVFAVQLAREKYGKVHPLYLKALSSLCQYCNEFKQDATTVELAKELLALTKRTYGCETLHLAQAHRILSKALMSQHDFHTSDGYYHHAMEAIRVARSQLMEGHPLLHPFLTNFAMALQWKSLHCPKEVKESTLTWAKTEATQALGIVSKHYGQISLRSANIYTLLGQILSKMNKLEAAEKCLVQSVEYLKLCQPSTSNHLLLAHATLGTFYRVIGQLDKAIFHLKQVPMLIESCGYLKWVHMSFETLTDLLQSCGETAGASVEDVNRLQIQLSLWLRDNPRDEKAVNISLLDSSPPPFQDFLDKFDSWMTAYHKVNKTKDIVSILMPITATSTSS